MLQRTEHNGGFSLIEAMIAMLIVAISFAGVYTLAGFATVSINDSADRQKMQMVADQILETISSDMDNINNYNMDFTTCAAPTSGQIEEYHQHRYKWCRMLNDAVGTPVAGDIRNIVVTTSGTSRIVHITLESRKKAAQVAVKNIYE